MADVEETNLPGVGVRHDFRSHGGQRLGVLVHRSGQRDLLLYDATDPDACRSVTHLDADDSRTLAELLGASTVHEALSTVQQQIEGLAIDWLQVEPASTLAGQRLSDAGVRTQTGVSIVAVMRAGDTVAAPGPDFALEAGDTAVVVGTPDGIRALLELVQ
ncbi:cation:proton antiporter regulatory subunit [soil metagenome]